MKTINGISVCEYPVTKEQWDAVCLWAAENGYSDLSCGWGEGRMPVGAVTWFDAVKFLNALSELAGLTPVYYDKNGNILRNGNSEPVIKNEANGYRLPLSEEWEEVCTAGTETKYFWGNDEIKVDGTNEYAWICKEAAEITKPVGMKKPNPYGLYDIIGNVWEWCFDTREEIFKALRGGSVALDAIVESRFEAYAAPDYKCYETGFRVFSSNAEAPDISEACEKSGHYGEYVKPVPQYRNMSKEAIAERFYNFLGDDELSKELKALIENGNIDEAFEKYRDVKFEGFLDVKLKPCKDIPYHSMETLFSLTEDSIIWLKGNYERHIHHNLDELFLFAEKYRLTGEEKYFKQYLVFLKSFLKRHKAEYDALPVEIMSEKNNVPVTWAWGNGFDPGKRARFIIFGFQQFAQALGKERFSEFPADLFVETAVAFATYGIQPCIKDGRFKVPNQIVHTSFCCLFFNHIFREYKHSDIITRVNLNRWKNSTENILMPDGCCMEQSLPYNADIIVYNGWLDDEVPDEKVTTPLKATTNNLQRMFSVVTTPYGVYPVSANHMTVAPPVKADKDGMKSYIAAVRRGKGNFGSERIEWQEFEKIKKVVFDNNKTEVPEFLSVYFPYGGVSVIREKWDFDSRYMYFFAARPGTGHRANCINDVQIYAFGRPMLLSGIDFNYNLKQDVPEEFHPFMTELNQYGQSSYSRNTILVDGKPQTRMRDIEPINVTYKTTAGYKWLDDESFVYAEGIYKDNYDDVTDVTHNRKVVFDKKNGLFIIADIMEAEKEHTYSQNWGFMPDGIEYFKDMGDKRYSWMGAGFKKDEIIIDEENRMIYTDDKENPNMYIYQLSNNEISYEYKYGEKEPIRGWYSYHNSEGMVYVPKMEISSKWQAKNSVVISVIETVPNNASRLENIEKSAEEMSFEISGDKYEIDISNGVSIKVNADEISVSGDEVFRRKSGEAVSVKAPCGFSWKKTEKGEIPVYFYE